MGALIYYNMRLRINGNKANQERLNPISESILVISSCIRNQVLLNIYVLVL